MLLFPNTARRTIGTRRSLLLIVRAAMKARLFSTRYLAPCIRRITYPRSLQILSSRCFQTATTRRFENRVSSENVKDVCEEHVAILQFQLGLFSSSYLSVSWPLMSLVCSFSQTRGEKIWICEQYFSQYPGIKMQVIFLEFIYLVHYPVTRW